MKKLIAFVLLVSILISFGRNVGKDNVFDIFFNASKVCLISEKQFDIDAKEKVVCGEKIFYYCDVNVAKDAYVKEMQYIDAVQFYFENEEIERILQKVGVRHYWESQIGDLKIYCGYSILFDDFVWVDGKKVNVQIAVREGEIICGFPVILTGY